jgi:hypothetical protein
MFRCTHAWLCATEVIHACKACISAVGFHQDERGLIVRDVVSIVVSIPVVIRIIVVLLA